MLYMHVFHLLCNDDKISEDAFEVSPTGNDWQSYIDWFVEWKTM